MSSKPTRTGPIERPLPLIGELASALTAPLFVAADPPSLDEEIACQSDRWSRASSEPWTIAMIAAALWGRRGGRDREAFREEVRAAVQRLVERGRVKVVTKDD